MAQDNNLQWKFAHAMRGIDGRIRGKGLLLATAMGTAMVPSAAFAQEAASAMDNDAIIVTAQRREQALEDVPMTVNFLSQETLASAGVNSVRDLAIVTTGYQLGQSGSVPQPAMRGVTTLINGAYENNVAIYIDGLYQTVPASINIDLPNIANVQVLKGAQGTLYGRNATGGAILIDTLSPNDYWEGDASLTYARFDDKRASAYLAGPLSDKVGLSLAGYIRETDGYYKKVSRTEVGKKDGNAFGLEQAALRAKLTVDLTDTLDATIGYAFTRSLDGRGVHFSPIENVERIYAFAPGGQYRPDELGETANNFDPNVRVKQNEVFLKLNLETGIGLLRSITGYQATRTQTNFDFDGTYIPAFYGVNEEYKDGTFQQTVDFSVTAFDKLDLVIGGQYFKIDTDYDQPSAQYFGPVFLGNLGYTYDDTDIPLSSYLLFSENYFHRRKDAWAFFADATFNVSDALSLTLGGRYSREKNHVWATKYGPGGIDGGNALYNPTTSVANPGVGADQSETFSKFTPRASIRFALSPDTNIYASYQKGFKSGEFNTTFPGDNPANWTPVNQESIDAFAIGVKHSDGALRFDIEGFYYDYTDVQVSLTRFDPSAGGTVTLLQNAPSAEIYGMEANVEYELMQDLNIRAGATYLHARYGDNFQFDGLGVSNDPTFGGAGCGTDPRQGNCGGVGLNTNSDPLKTYLNVSQVQDLSGLQMARSPDFTAYLGMDYLISMGEGGLRFAVNAKYTDSYVVTNPSVFGANPGVPVERQLEQRFREGNYVLLNVSATWTDPSEKIYVRVFGNNLTDHKYRLHYNGTSTFGTYAPMAEPLTYGITVGYHF